VGCLHAKKNITAIAEARPFWTTSSILYNHLDGKLAFVAWYVGEAMEEAEFPEAHEDLALVKNNYGEVAAEAITRDGGVTQ
jgi:tubulin alpha